MMQRRPDEIASILRPVLVPVHSVVTDRATGKTIFCIPLKKTKTSSANFFFYNSANFLGVRYLPPFSSTDEMLALFVGFSDIEGVEYGTCFASSKKNENLNLSTSVAHTKKSSSLLLEHTNTSFLSKYHTRRQYDNLGKI
jgi:hypothetical protein